MPATHSQPAADVTGEVRDLTRRAADLCRRDPSRFAAAVRHADALHRAGAEPLVALRQALNQVAPG